METKNTVKVPFWAKLRNAKNRIKALESREQSLLRELDNRRVLCDRLQAERDNSLEDCKALQKQAEKCNERVSRILALLEDSTTRKAEQKTMYDYSGLDYHFKKMASLEESKQSVMEAASVLAMIPYTDSVDEKAAHCHTIAECLYEYQGLLNRIGVRVTELSEKAQ